MSIEPENTTKYDQALKISKITHAKHDRYRKDSIIVGTVSSNGRKKKVERVEYGKCSECGHEIKASDQWRGETVCQRCGALSKGKPKGNRDYIGKTFESLPRDTGITDEEWAVLCKLKSKRHLKLETEENFLRPPKGVKKTEYRKSHYLITVDIFGSQLQMNMFQKDRVKYILKNHTLKEIHSRVKAKTVIAGVCRYVLEQDGRGRELRFNRDPFISVGLNMSNYRVMKQNLNRLMRK
ncbi:hypothetical protein [Methanobacterium paludis]|uniref:Uncharacterized protein n=1 Tax=Methanobacterium paludis (strain DSM 25820 / JCM 18151 / SWAN1) TaxID=868131 RepID=F6D4U8_METPW|nr:hypothetical protein [Methanobacterium paludis]AEG18157.1 hypothetical protein MSWAN_1139 [Methanobacterium paludis]